MSYISENMQNQINKIDYKVELALKLRNEEIYEEIKKIEKKYDDKIRVLKQEKEKIEKLSYLSFDDSMNAIEYLVNNMEEENYELVTLKKNNKEKKDTYFVTGLMKTTDKIIQNQDEEEIVDGRFIELARYTRSFLVLTRMYSYLHENERCKVNYLSSKKMESRRAMKGMLDTFINDDDFMYIKDYIKRVIDYRLNKQDYEITLDEMKKEADSFIEEHKNSKKLVK